MTEKYWLFYMFSENLREFPFLYEVMGFRIIQVVTFLYMTLLTSCK